METIPELELPYTPIKFSVLWKGILNNERNVASISIPLENQSDLFIDIEDKPEWTNTHTDSLYQVIMKCPYCRWRILFINFHADKVTNCDRHMINPLLPLMCDSCVARLENKIKKLPVWREEDNVIQNP